VIFGVRRLAAAFLTFVESWFALHEALPGRRESGNLSAPLRVNKLPHSLYTFKGDYAFDTEAWQGIEIAADFGIFSDPPTLLSCV